jgi:N-acetylglucosamine-6-phosphate deacetylase
MNLATGYFDLQVNGYAGVDFNQDGLSPDDLHRACDALQRHRVAGVLATIITDDVDRMCERLHRLVRLREGDELARQIITGLHIEGPFINPAPGYVGAHPRDAVRPAEADVMQRLLDAGDGLVRLVTLAPEQDQGHRTTRHLADQGVVISAGHCDASLDDLRGAIDAGLTMFTHLGNGCPQELPRHDNIIQRALSLRKDLWLCMIADGVHVPFFALHNYLDLAGDRAIVVTDAMAAAGLGPGRHRLGRWEIEVGDDLAAWAPDRSHLVGSAMTMPQAAANLEKHLGLPTTRIHALTRTHPLHALGLMDSTVVDTPH